MAMQGAITHMLPPASAPLLTLKDTLVRVPLPSAVPAIWMSTKKASPLGALVVMRFSSTKPPASFTSS